MFIAHAIKVLKTSNKVDHNTSAVLSAQYMNILNHWICELGVWDPFLTSLWITTGLSYKIAFCPQSIKISFKNYLLFLFHIYIYVCEYTCNLIFLRFGYWSIEFHYKKALFLCNKKCHIWVLFVHITSRASIRLTYLTTKGLFYSN